MQRRVRSALCGPAAQWCRIDGAWSTKLWLASTICKLNGLPTLDELRFASASARP
jgi:hypothetical protein